MNDFITTLNKLIIDRKKNPRPGSYTNSLLDNPQQAAQKVGEEATEVVIAALSQDDAHLIEEAADLIYHTLVLLNTRDVSWEQVVQRLEERQKDQRQLPLSWDRQRPVKAASPTPLP